MKLFIALVSATSFTAGLLGGVLLCGSSAPALPLAHVDEHPAAPTWHEPLTIAMQVEAASIDAPARIDVGAGCDGELQFVTDQDACLPPSDATAPAIAASLSIVPIAQEDESLAQRLSLEREEAMRAWLPFRCFVQQREIDTRSLEDEPLRALFERFVQLNEQRHAELVRFVRPPEQDAGQAAVRAEDLAVVEAVQARYSELEDALARELCARR